MAERNAKFALHFSRPKASLCTLWMREGYTAVRKWVEAIATGRPLKMEHERAVQSRKGAGDDFGKLTAFCCASAAGSVLLRIIYASFYPMTAKISTISTEGW